MQAARKMCEIDQSECTSLCTLLHCSQAPYLTSASLQDKIQRKECILVLGNSQSDSPVRLVYDV